MNAWYFAAIFFGALAAFCTYYGLVVESRRSADEQTTHNESKLQVLGTQIQNFVSTLARRPSQQRLKKSMRSIEN